MIYQALYGDKGMWVRPESVFTQRIERNGKFLRRFQYCEAQGAILEVATLQVEAGQGDAFEDAFRKAQTIIASMRGYISHELRPCVQIKSKYILLVHWQSLEDHTIGFRQSAEYQQWKNLLHQFYRPSPTVEHYRAALQ